MRALLFVLTNLAVMVVVGAVCMLLGLDQTSLIGLSVFALLFGMGGALISLLMSKQIAKWSMRAKVLTGNEGEQARWLVQTVESLAMQAAVKMPEVAIYQGAPNAFATGAFRNSALVAVSSGLLEKLQPNEVRAVLGHELSHVANGDMVTMTLLQGVLNACIILLSRVIGITVDRTVFGNKRGYGLGYVLTYLLMQMVLGIFASLIVMAYSRHREYAADAGAAKLLGAPRDMINALRRLGEIQSGTLPEGLRAFGIADSKKSLAELFASHPSMEKRIARLSESTGLGY